MRLIDADRTKGVMERTLDDLKLFFLSREQRAHLISAFDTVKLIIDNAPTVDAVSVRHGEWVDVMTEDWCTFDECKCSECGVVEYFNKGWKRFSYCPNCGATMDGERKD